MSSDFVEIEGELVNTGRIERIRKTKEEGKLYTTVWLVSGRRISINFVGETERDRHFNNMRTMLSNKGK